MYPLRSTQYLSQAVTLGLLFTVWLTSRAVAQPLTVTHVCPESDTDARHAYFIDLLDLVLQKTGGAYRLVAHEAAMQQGRALKQLKKGEGLDVVWTMTSEERERAFLPIRVPLFKGLVGTRLLLINKTDQLRFEQIASSRQLQALHAGQGHDWPDTDILTHNGYTVTGSASYEGLFKMLAKRRIDYFPRSILEIWQEADQYAGEDLIVESSIVLQYPAAIYFFVNKKNDVLAQRLEEGLRRALADGSFDALFFERFGESLRRARLSARRRIDLTNFLLPAGTPLDQPSLWYQY